MVTTAFEPVSPARPGASRALRVGFTPAAGSLVAGSSTGPIELRFNASTWQPLTETNDYSCSSQATGGDWPSVTLYRQGELVWGLEP